MNRNCSVLDRAIDPAGDFTSRIIDRDFLDVHLQRLSAKQRAAVVAWAHDDIASLAAAEGVSEEAIYWRLREGLGKLRAFAGVN